jgi:transcriptional regulator with XRE-family HTH domain
MKVISNAKSLKGRMCDRIRAARHAARLSQAALATRLGVTPGAVAQWESAEGTRPGVDRLDAIASATGAVLEWLAFGRGDMRRRQNVVVDSLPAIALDTFAQDYDEEVMLTRFRLLPPQARSLLSGFLDAMISRRGKRTIR